MITHNKERKRKKERKKDRQTDRQRKKEREKERKKERKKERNTLAHTQPLLKSSLCSRSDYKTITILQGWDICPA